MTDDAQSEVDALRQAYRALKKDMDDVVKYVGEVGHTCTPKDCAVCRVEKIYKLQEKREVSKP